ncbi:hypothetical protein [Quatrionicoccus australiensis]|uniref:hypothetical protein n=1 Tax=Quatrionicoccus australiensis TaxID=138118 RepID=UPI001CFB73CA|nr:hypothetical protein [Quatrionicoccus australiensis]MCB4360763.1 hypothetical protein [Quatrionicoccus australiensis]
MSRCRLLHLDRHHRLTAYRQQGGELHQEGSFVADEAGLNSFSDYLHAPPALPCRLLSDLGDEELVVDNIPLLRGKDRQTLIQRRTQQHLNGAQLHTVISLGHIKARRKEEKLLFIGLNKVPDLTPWLQQIAAAEIPLAGIYTPPQLNGLLLHRLARDTQHCLLLTQHAHTLRESYLQHGQTVFSRATALSTDDIKGNAFLIAGEATRLQQYLLGQRQIEHAACLTVNIIAKPEITQALQASCQNDANRQFTITDIPSAARQLKLNHPPADAGCEHLFLHLLGHAPPRQQFATAAQRQDFRLWQTRRALAAASFGILFGSALYAGEESWRAQNLHQESVEYATSEMQMQARYAEIAATFPQLDIDNESLRHLTNRHRELQRRQASPSATFQFLGQVMDEHPGIELENIRWEITVPDTSTAGNLPAAVEITSITGSIQSGEHSSRPQNQARFEQFVEHLQRAPATQLSLTRPPYAISSDKILRSNEARDGETGRFSLRLTRHGSP